MKDARAATTICMNKSRQISSISPWESDHHPAPGCSNGLYIAKWSDSDYLARLCQDYTIGETRVTGYDMTLLSSFLKSPRRQPILKVNAESHRTPARDAPETRSTTNPRLRLAHYTIGLRGPKASGLPLRQPERINTFIGTSTR